MSDERHGSEAMTALEYHLLTSHDRWNMGGHGLDWANQPKVFKNYPQELDLTVHPLPEDLSFPLFTPQQVLNEAVAPIRKAPPNMLPILSKVLTQACGLTARSRHDRGEFHYRAAASAGALYPIELYTGLAASCRSEALSGNVHHYRPHMHDLLDLGIATDCLGKAAWACGYEDGGDAVAVFLLTGIFFRSAWKYRERAYRYVLLDGGHVIENLLLALRAEGLFPVVRHDFDDEAMNSMLCLKEDREACIAVIFAYPQKPQHDCTITPVPAPLEHKEAPVCGIRASASVVSQYEIVYEPIRRLHAAGHDLGKAADISEKSNAVFNQGLEFKPLPLPELPVDKPQPTLAQCIMGRRSRRNFVPEDLNAELMAAVVYMVCAMDPEGMSPDCPTPPVRVAAALRNVDSAACGDGLFLLRNEHNHAPTCARLHAGVVHDSLANVCLGQHWLKNANAHFLFLTDLANLESHKGARCYRHAMLEAGRLGQRVYLAATALGLGACGIGAFFDAEANTLLRLGNDTQLLYLTAMGLVRG